MDPPAPAVSGDLHATSYFILLSLFLSIGSVFLAFSMVLPRTPATLAAAKAATLTMAVSVAGFILPREEPPVFLVLVHGTRVLVTSVMMTVNPFTVAVARMALLGVELSVGGLVLPTHHHSDAHLMELFVVVILSQTFPVMAGILRQQR